MRCAISDVPKSNVTRYGGLRATPTSVPSTKNSTRSTSAASVEISSAFAPITCAPAAGATKRTVAANAGSAARRARKRDRIFAIMPSLFTPYVKKVKPSPRRNPPPTRLSVPCENRPQSRMPRRPWFLAILLVFLALRAAAEDVQALRARAGVRFFRSLLAADVDLPKKTIPPDQLLIVFFYVDDARGAKDLMARFGEQAKELRGLPVVTETTKDATLSAYAQRVPAGVFIAQPPNKKTLASIIKYGIDHHVIVYSPYEGHVESGDRKSTS